MHSISQRLKIATNWIASYFRGKWVPGHYPIDLRQQVGVPVEAKWSARVLNWPGPTGLGKTEDEARSALIDSLHAISIYRLKTGQSMPRPGTKVPIEFASSTRVNADTALLDDFIEQVLGFGPDEGVFISDLSSIGDFGDDDEVARIRARIEQLYGLAVTESGPILIADILERVRALREGYP